MMIKRLMCAALTSGLVVGCASTSELSLDRSLQFNEIEVINISRDQVHDFKIKVQNNDRVFKCGLVIADGFCSYAFDARPYEGNSITVSWISDGEAISRGPLVIPAPSFVDDELYKVVFEFEHADSFKAFFETQDQQ